ncbi:MAG: Ig-like domain-containing protein [Tannerella sp.]|nr:Ig-like domain-containing protein [Tannerella sp.]
MALLCAILSLAAGNMQAETRTVTTEILDATLPGSLLHEIAQLQDGDTLTFDRDQVDRITLTQENTGGAIIISKSVSILGDGVTIDVTGSSSSAPYIHLKGSIQVENMHWEAGLYMESPSRMINCTFKPYYSKESSLNCGNSSGAHSIEGCAFLTAGDEVAWVEYFTNTNVHLISCTIINETQGADHKTFVRQYRTTSASTKYVTFTNCVLLDPGATEASPSVSLYNILSKGYNVFQGVMKPYGSGPAWAPKESDITLALDAAPEDLPLTYDEGIYKVTAGKAAHRHLPTNPTNTIADLAGVNFPVKDLSGNVIDYNTKNSHSGAWQSVYGDESGGGGDVVVTDITVNFPADGVVFTDTTWNFQAVVHSQDGNAEQEVNWECDNANVTITPSGAGNLQAAFYAEGITEDTPIKVTLTAKENGADGQPFVKEFALTLKPYVHVAGIDLPDLPVTFGYTAGLRAVVLPANANWKELEWTIDDPAVASLSVEPGTDSITVTGLTVGTTTLRAKAKDNEFMATTTVTVSRADYSEGVFVVNEDWFGHSPGSINFLYKNGRIDHRAFRRANHTPPYYLGSVAQYGAIYGGKFYIISKNQFSFAVADARTLELHKSFAVMGGEGRSFLGVDEHTGYVGTANGIRIVNLDELPNVPGNHVDNGWTDPKRVIMLPGTDITSIQSGGGTYTGQIGTMKRVGERIFAIQQGVLHVITAAGANIHRVETTLTDHIYTTMAQSKDGYLWLGTSGQVPSGTSEEDFDEGSLTNYFVRLDPWTLEQKVVPLPGSTTGTSATFGAWQADAFQGSEKENVLYWKSGQQCIIRYDIATNRVDTVLDLSGMPFLPGIDAPWTLYGTSFAVDHLTGELVATTGTFILSCCVNDRNNWKILRVNPNGGQPRADAGGKIGNILSEHPLDKNYWFPAMPVFPDTHRPEFTNVSFPAGITLGGTHHTDSLGLLDKVVDADNMRAAMVTSVLDGYNTSLINAFIWRDTLVVAARKTIPAGQPAESTTLTLKFNSNGHVITKELAVTLQPSVTVNPVTGVALNYSNVELTAGQTLSLTATVAPANADNRMVTWTSSVQSVALVDNNGAVTALAPGTTVITATTVEGGFTATCTITVKAAGPSTVPVTGVALNRTTAELTVGQTLQLTATVAPANATNRAVTWTSSTPAVASVSSAGVVTAHIAPAAAVITATTADGGFTATCVVATKAEESVVNPFELNQHSLTLYPAQTVRLGLTAPQHFNVTWSSSNTAVATVSSAGDVHSISAGSAVITARDVAKGKVDMCAVTVLPVPEPAVESVTLNTSYLALTQGETAMLQVTTSQGLAWQQRTWSASNPGVADVTASGMVITFAPGTSVIRVTIGAYSATCTVQVSAPRTGTEVDNITQSSAQLYLSTVANASYYLVHLYTKQGVSLVPVYTLKVMPDGSSTIVTLRAGSNSIAVPLLYLSPATPYIYEVEAIRETQGRADVIHTEMSAFTTASQTGVEGVADAQPKVWYANGTLRLENLDGYTCTVMSMTGQHTHVFGVVSPDDHRRVQLQRGTYVLSAQKDGIRKVFKFAVF